MSELSELIKTIASLHREHRGLQRAVGDMTRRIKGEERWFARDRILREGGKVTSKFPPVTDEDKARVRSVRARYYLAQDYLEQLRQDVYKKLIEAAKQLPVTATVTEIRGFGVGSLAAIVGEAGDLSKYSNPAKLWKRFSLHTINGHAARRVKGVINGFVPHRRAEMHVIGDSLLRSGGPYADLYQARKLVEVDKAIAARLTILPAADIPLVGKDSYISEGQIHKRALRYIEKALLKYVWRAWRDAAKIDESRVQAACDIQTSVVPGNGVEATREVIPSEVLSPRRRRVTVAKSRDRISVDIHAGAVPGNGVEANEPLHSTQKVPPRRRGKVAKSPGNGVEATNALEPRLSMPPLRRVEKTRPPVDWQDTEFRDQVPTSTHYASVPGNGVEATGVVSPNHHLPPRRRGRPPKIRPPVEL